VGFVATNFIVGRCTISAIAAASDRADQHRRSLEKDAPIPREVQGVGRIFDKPHLGGLHHQSVRI